jgi:hypothetical protein
MDLFSKGNSMPRAFRNKLPRLIAPLLLLAAGLAHAQWSWIDEKGIRQLSDRPPPPGTPANKILKAPGKPPTPAAEADQAAAREKADPRPAAEREADFRNQMQKMTAKRADPDAKNGRPPQKDCQQARKYKDWVETGAPVFAKGEDGKPRPMTMQERVDEIKLAEAVLQRCS